MCETIIKLRASALVLAGLAILAAGSGCADSASTLSRANRIDTVSQVFPSAVEVAETSASSGIANVSEIRDASNLLGYLVETQVAGRSGPFRIAVLLDERRVVKRATVVSYPWSRGREVARGSFASQFEGKGPGDAIEIGKDIDAVSGATISCKAMARGVREAVGRLAK